MKINNRIHFKTLVNSVYFESKIKARRSGQITAELNKEVKNFDREEPDYNLTYEGDLPNFKSYEDIHEENWLEDWENFCDKNKE